MKVYEVKWGWSLLCGIVIEEVNIRKNRIAEENLYR